MFSIVFSQTINLPFAFAFEIGFSNFQFKMFFSFMNSDVNTLFYFV